MTKKVSSKFKHMFGKIIAILGITILIASCGNGTGEEKTPDSFVVRISGTIKDSQGNPAKNKRVEVDVLGVEEILEGTLKKELESGIKIFYVVSDESGNYMLEWKEKYWDYTSNEIDFHFHVEVYDVNDSDPEQPDVLGFKPVYYADLNKTVEDGVWYISKTVDFELAPTESATE